LVASGCPHFISPLDLAWLIGVARFVLYKNIVPGTQEGKRNIFQDGRNVQNPRANAHGSDTPLDMRPIVISESHVLALEKSSGNRR
jgi:hypothetical protein